MKLSLLDEVKRERDRQDFKWNGCPQDATYSPNDWYSLISDYLGWMRRMWAMGSKDKARRRLIQIAALCLAAVERIDDSEECPF